MTAAAFVTCFGSNACERQQCLFVKRAHNYASKVCGAMQHKQQRRQHTPMADVVSFATLVRLSRFRYVADFSFWLLLCL